MRFFFLFLVTLSTFAFAPRADAYWTGMAFVDCGYGYLHPLDTSGDEYHRCHYTGRTTAPDGSPWGSVNMYLANEPFPLTYSIKAKEVAWAPNRNRRIMTRTFILPYTATGDWDTGLGNQCVPFAYAGYQVGFTSYIKAGESTVSIAAVDKDFITGGGDPDCQLSGDTILEEVVKPSASNPHVDLELCFPDEDNDGHDECVYMAKGSTPPSEDGPDRNSYGDIFYDCGLYANCDAAFMYGKIWEILGGSIDTYNANNTIADSLTDPLGWNFGLEYGALFRKVSGATVTYEVVRFELEHTTDGIRPRSYKHNVVMTHDVQMVPSAISWDLSITDFLSCHAPLCALWDFRWNGGQYADTFRLQSAPTASGPWTNHSTHTSREYLAHLGQSGKYWRIRGENAYGNGLWSSVEFTNGMCASSGGGGGGGEPPL